MDKVIEADRTMRQHVTRKSIEFVQHAARPKLEHQDVMIGLEAMTF